MLKRVFHTTKGSTFVETAMCLPIFIITLGLMISTLLKTGYQAKLIFELSRNAGYSCLLNYDLPEETDYLLSSGVNSKYDLSASVYYRPFVGENTNSENDDIVYVFPKSGEKYHLPGCSTIDYNKNYVVMSKEDAENEGYTPCKLCMEGGEDFFKKWYN